MKTSVRAFAFYLPQYHPISENNEWWGEGFTEWHNVAQSKPRFYGHHQPQIPSDLGFYDLRLIETHYHQAKLAKESGIEGFCYYHYWFNGKLLLNRPLELVLENPQLDLPFMLCWANENWSRKWDGKDQEILIEQNYETYSVEKHFEYLSRYFEDDRYAKVNDMPVLVIYRANKIPNLSKFVNTIKDLAKAAGHIGIYLLSVSISPYDDDYAVACGIDKIIDFQPSKNHPQRGLNVEFIKYIAQEVISGDLSIKVTRILPKLEFAKVFNYKKLAEKKINEKLSMQYIPCVIPSWDNSARRQTDSTVIQNHDPKIFGNWLKHAIETVSSRDIDERIVFINAWNEWAEGCHLEPDSVNGMRFLNEVKNVLDKDN